MHCLSTFSPLFHGDSSTIAWILRPKNAKCAEDPFPRYLAVLISDTCGPVPVAERSIYLVATDTGAI